jgi:Secretion system C-terminal sorting domain
MKKMYAIAVAIMFIVNISFSQTERNTLIETFTSSTCGPCNPGNAQLQSLLADSQNDDKAVSLKYQMSWPSPGDPYFTDEGNARKQFYSIGGIPATRLDGLVEYNPASMTQANLNTQYAIPATMDIVAHYQVDEVTKTVDVQVVVEALEETTTSVRLYIAIFEYGTNGNVGNNGETSFHHVMKKMLPSSVGTSIMPMSVGEIENNQLSHTFVGNYRLPQDAGDQIVHSTEHSVEEFSDLGVVVWVQKPSGVKQVHQAVYADMTSAGIDENNGSIETAKVYPNPVTDNAAIAFHSTITQNVTINVFDVFGQLVHTKEMQNVEAGRSVYELSTENFATGLYSVSIGSESGSITKRFVVQ